MSPRRILAMIGIHLIWGVTPIFLKLGMAEMPPLMLMALRFVVVSVILIPVTRWHRGQMKRVFGIAFTAGALSFATLAAGLALVGNMGQVGIAGQLNAPFAAVLSVLILGEAVRWRRWLGIGLAFGGSSIVAFDPSFIHFLDGFALVTLSSFLNSVSIIMMRGAKGVRPLEMQAWLAHVSWPVILLLSLIFEPHAIQGLNHAGWEAWFAILFTSLGTNMVAQAGFYWFVQRYEVSRIAPFLLLSPLFTILFGVLLMGDTLTLRIVIGGMMTLIGVTIINMRDRHGVEERVTP